MELDDLEKKGMKAGIKIFAKITIRMRFFALVLLHFSGDYFANLNTVFTFAYPCIIYMLVPFECILVTDL